MALVAPEAITRAGITPTFTAASAGGDEFAFSGNNFVIFRNASAAPITVTVVTPGDVEGLAIADATITVPVGDLYVGGLAGRVFQNPQRRVGVTYSTEVGLSVAVLSL